ncbi:hypothetical protein C8Q74DRAFT_857173 [Fomes fomentarius]|nr:hypothetical protein C8Q74DRAFT_857173 [Fomes fomentarius]
MDGRCPGGVPTSFDASTHRRSHGWQRERENGKQSASARKSTPSHPSLVLVFALSRAHVRARYERTKHANLDPTPRTHSHSWLQWTIRPFVWTSERRRASSHSRRPTPMHRACWPSMRVRGPRTGDGKGKEGEDLGACMTARPSPSRSQTTADAAQQPEEGAQTRRSDPGGCSLAPSALTQPRASSAVGPHVFVQEWGASASGFDLVRWLPSFSSHFPCPLATLARTSGSSATDGAVPCSLSPTLRLPAISSRPSASSNLLVSVFSNARVRDWRTSVQVLMRRHRRLSHFVAARAITHTRNSRTATPARRQSSIPPSPRPFTESTAAHPCHLPSAQAIPSICIHIIRIQYQPASSSSCF